ncbi:MAG: serine/threonine protein kinase [Candidatus Wallbacteria bacterium]|nr:serine/threonine protein kinase [Candidatus Wallbacteria bacterium]
MSVQRESDQVPPGTILAGYQVGELLGAGGMGAVYRARQLSLDRPVALKILSWRLAEDREARERFLQEARIAARLAHPRLVRVYEAGQSEGHLFIACELMTGGTLRDRLVRAGALEVAEARDVVAGCADALAVLHAGGVLHRDVKPENIFVAPGRGALLGDFGIAKDTAGSAVRTRAGLLLGTPRYMAPELARGDEATGAADLYALGVVLFECLAGEPPFVAADPSDLLLSHVRDDAPSVCAARPGVPRAYDDFLRVALAKKPAARHASPQAFARALAALPGGAVEPKAATAAAPTTAVAPASGRRKVASATTRVHVAPVSRRGLPVAVAASLLAMVALIGLWRTHRAQAPAGPAVTETPSVPASAAGTPEQAERLEKDGVHRIEDVWRELMRTNERAKQMLPPPPREEHIKAMDSLARNATQAAVECLTALGACGVVEAEASAGRVMSAYFLALFGSRSKIGNVGEQAIRKGQFTTLNRLGEWLQDTFSKNVAEQCARVLEAARPRFEASADPTCQAGLLAVQALEKGRLLGKQTEALGRALAARAGGALSGVLGRNDLTARDHKVVRALCDALRYLGQLEARERLGNRGLGELERRLAGRPFSPIEVIVHCDLVRAVVETPTQIREMGWDQVLLRQRLESWKLLLEKLIRDWPYEPRRPLPRGPRTVAVDEAALLQPELDDRLAHCRMEVARMAEMLRVPVPPEPPLRP